MCQDFKTPGFCRITEADVRDDILWFWWRMVGTDNVLFDKLMKRNYPKIIMAPSALLLACLKVAAWEPSGSIEGRITLAGSPPPESKVDLKDYPQLEALYPDGLMTRRFIVGAKGGLTNVLVYLEGNFP